MAYKKFTFSLFIFTCLSDEYINICYNNYDDSGEKVNIMVNKKLPFFPDTFIIPTEVRENTYTVPVRKQKTSTHIFKKSAHSCDDPFIYTVPWSALPLQTIKFSIDSMLDCLLIDVFKTAVKPNFTENVLEMEGLLGNVKMRVVLVHKNYSKLRIYEPQDRSAIDFDFNSKVRKLKYGETYCMAFLTTDFSNILSLSLDKHSSSKPWKYHIFEISIYKRGRFWEKNKRRYLTELFPCKKAKFMQRKMSIMVDPNIIKLKLKFNANSGISFFKNTYFFRNGQPKAGKGFGYLHFNDLELIQQPLTREMVDRRENILIYFSKRTKKLCPVRLPENFDQLGLSSVEFRMAEIGTVYVNSYYVDFASKEFDVFNIKPIDGDICLTQSI